MLTGISPLLSPELLKVLCEMGHGDELVLADSNFPAASHARRLVRADGIGMLPLLSGILPLFPLDSYDASAFVVMAVVPGDPVEPVIWPEYQALLRKHSPQTALVQLERFAYNERARQAYAIVATGETARYANVILKKGCVL